MITRTELQQRLQAIGPWHSCTYEFTDNIQQYAGENITLDSNTITVLIQSYLDIHQPDTVDVENSRTLLWNILRRALYEIEDPVDTRTVFYDTYLI